MQAIPKYQLINFINGALVCATVFGRFQRSPSDTATTNYASAVTIQSEDASRRTAVSVAVTVLSFGHVTVTAEKKGLALVERGIEQSKHVSKNSNCVSCKKRRNPSDLE